MSSDNVNDTNYIICMETAVEKIEETFISMSETLLSNENHGKSLDDFSSTTTNNLVRAPDGLEGLTEDLTNKSRTCSTSVNSSVMGVQTDQGSSCKSSNVTSIPRDSLDNTEDVRPLLVEQGPHEIVVTEASVYSSGMGVQTDQGLVAPETSSTGKIEQNGVNVVRTSSQGSPQKQQQQGRYLNDPYRASETPLKSESGTPNATTPMSSTGTTTTVSLNQTLDNDSVTTQETAPQPVQISQLLESPKDQKVTKKLSPLVPPFKPQSLEATMGYPTPAGLTQQQPQPQLPSPYPKLTEVPSSPPVYPIFSIPLIRCCYDSQYHNSAKTPVHPSRLRKCERGGRCYHRHVTPRLADGGDGLIVEAVELFAHLYAPSIKAFYDNVLANADFAAKQNPVVLKYSKLRHDELPCQYGQGCKNEAHRLAAERIYYGEESKKLYEEFSKEMRAYEYTVIQQRHQEMKLKQHCQLTGAKPWSEPAPQYSLGNFNNNALQPNLTPSILGSQLQPPSFLDAQSQSYYNASRPPILSYPSTPLPYAPQYPYSLPTSGVVPDSTTLNMLALAASGAGLGPLGQANAYYNYLLQAQNRQQQQQLQNLYNPGANLFPNFQPNAGVQPGFNPFSPLLPDSTLRPNVETEMDLMSISANSNIGVGQMSRPQTMPQTLLPHYNNNTNNNNNNNSNNDNTGELKNNK